MTRAFTPPGTRRMAANMRAKFPDLKLKDLLTIANSIDDTLTSGPDPAGRDYYYWLRMVRADLDALRDARSASAVAFATIYLIYDLESLISTASKHP